jgi:tetratricopeptide (TPR) repeat protein
LILFTAAVCHISEKLAVLFLKEDIIMCPNTDKNFSPSKILEESLKKHLSNMHNYYSSSGGFNKMKLKWDKLIRPEIMDFSTNTILQEMRNSLINQDHYYQSKNFGDIYMIVSTVPRADPYEAKTYFKNGYFNFLDQHINTSNYGLGNIDLAHWIICCDGKLQNTHLTFLIASNDQGPGAINVLAQDLMNASELTHEGYKLAKADKLEEAIYKYKQALKLDSKFFLARSNMGHALRKQGKLKEAIAEWEELLKQGAPPKIAIPVPGLIDDAKKLLYEQENKGKDKDLPNAAELVKLYIEELEKPEANWRDINTKVIRIGETAIPNLITALKSKNELLQKRVVHLIHFIGGKIATDALIEAYKEGNEELRKNIKYYIKNIDDQIISVPKKKIQKKWWKFWDK